MKSSRTYTVLLVASLGVGLSSVGLTTGAAAKDANPVEAVGRPAGPEAALSTHQVAGSDLRPSVAGQVSRTAPAGEPAHPAVTGIARPTLGVATDHEPGRSPVGSPSPDPKAAPGGRVPGSGKGDAAGVRSTRRAPSDTAERVPVRRSPPRLDEAWTSGISEGFGEELALDRELALGMGEPSPSLAAPGYLREPEPLPVLTCVGDQDDPAKKGDGWRITRDDSKEKDPNGNPIYQFVSEHSDGSRVSRTTYYHDKEQKHVKTDTYTRTAGDGSGTRTETQYDTKGRVTNTDIQAMGPGGTQCGGIRTQYRYKFSGNYKDGITVEIEYRQQEWMSSTSSWFDWTKWTKLDGKPGEKTARDRKAMEKEVKERQAQKDE